MALPAMSGAPSMAEPLPPEPVDVTTFAAVSAGIAEGFPEAEVLAHHGLARPTWEASRASWTRRLVEEGQEGPLFASYRGALFAREDELGREVAPVDRDLEAWLGFLAAVALEDPAALFARTGLRLPDLSRLSRHWASRLDGDDELRARAEERRAAGVEPALPPLRLGTSSLSRPQARPEGRADAVPKGASAPTDVASFEAMSVAEYVAVMARLERPENLLRSILRTKHIDEAVWHRERRKIEAAAAEDPVFRREVAVLLSFERSRLDVAKSSERSFDSVPPPPASELFAHDLVAPAPLPPPPPPPAATYPTAPASVPPPPPASYPPPPPPASFRPPAPATYAVERPLPAFEIEDEGTSLADEATAFELPFAVPAAPLPFSLAEPEPASPEPQAFPPHVPAPATASHGGEPASTRPLSISIEDHARLHVELNAGYGEAETLARYGVEASARAAMDAHVDAMKRRDPAAAKVWLEAYQAHAAWLLAVDSADA